MPRCGVNNWKRKILIPESHYNNNISENNHITMSMIIREAQEEDIQELEKLFQITRQQTFKHRDLSEFKIGDYVQSTKEDVVWVAVKNGKIAGFISVFIPDFIHNLFVDRLFQNQGIGTQLLQKAEEHLADRIELKIALDNLGACQFYQKHGWQEVSVHRDEPEPYLLYRKLK